MKFKTAQGHELNFEHLIVVGDIFVVTDNGGYMITIAGWDLNKTIESLNNARARGKSVEIAINYLIFDGETKKKLMSDVLRENVEKALNLQ